MRLSVAVAAIGLSICSLCAAADSWASTTRQLNLPAQALGSALESLARDYNFQLVFVSEEIANTRSDGVIGTFTPEEALKRVLNHTGFTYRFINDRTVTILRTTGATPIANVYPAQPDPSDDPPGRVRMRLAQLNQPAPGDSSAYERGNRKEDQLEEVTVTATKRTEKLGDVPISITALTQDALAQSSVRDLRDVAALVPGIELDMAPSFGPNLTNIAIRGVNSTIGTSTTGIYLDDTPIQSRVQSTSFVGDPIPLTWDLERVEVDRGPQGTLFGAGAEGGAVRFVSQEPSLTEFGGSAHSEVSATQYGAPSYESGIAAGGPLIDGMLGARISLWYRKDGGYVDRIDPLTGATVDPNANRSDTKGARLAVAFQPIDGLKITPSVNFQSQHIHDVGVFFEDLSDPQQGVFKNGRLVAQPFTDTLYLPSLKVEANVGFADLTSISSYYHRYAPNIWDVTNFLGALFGGYGSPLGPSYPTSYSQAGVSTDYMKQSFVSQELRLTSHDATAPLSWVSGLFYSRVRQEDGEVINSETIAKELDTEDPIDSTAQYIVDTQVAAFGQIDYRVISQLKLTAGVRVADVKYAATEYSTGALNAGVPPIYAGGSRETPVTPKAGVSFQYDENNLFYANVAKGYRVGGVNTPLPSFCNVPPAQSSYDSDSVWSYEVGAKNNLLGGSLQIDTSVFHINWNNIQQEVLVPSCGFEYITNAGKASINGLDFAVSALLFGHFKPSLAASYTDAHYSQTIVSDGAVIVDKGDAIGIVPQVPSPWNLTGALEYSKEISADWRLKARIEDIFHSRNNGPFASYDPAAISYEPDIPPNPSTNLLNLRVSATYASVEVYGFVNNLANSTPLLNYGKDIINTNLVYNTTLRPRTIGVGAYWRFP
jgi:iron complex outermembrane recepter protein